MSLWDGFLSLAKDTNKTKGSEETKADGISNLSDELKLSISDEDLIEKVKSWEKKWNEWDRKGEWEKFCKDNENYWKGKQFSDVTLEDRPLVDNAIFEALETFLPQATRRNPEPTVDLAASEEQSPENLEIAKQFKNRLADLADTLKIRLKIKRTTRHWAIYLLGAVELGWDASRNDITVKVVRPQKLILDPDGMVDEDGYSGKYVGKKRRLEASVLSRMIPEKTSVIKKMVDGKMGTDIHFTEWWTDEYFCWTWRDIVLLKRTNPHWNYDTPEKMDEGVDDFGAPIQETIPAQPGQNHFSAPKIPILFLSIFNLGLGPVDDTSLIGQNLSLQDLINKKNRQIDRNADSQNNGAVISGERSGLTKEQAQEAIEAINAGGAVWVPQGDATTAVARITAPPLPADIFNDLADKRNRLKEVFGVKALTPSGIQGDKTVRGKILTKATDTDRIGGGITEYLEQFADDIYNYMVQLMYVYYEPLQGTKLPKLIVSVKEGSLLPKDSVAEAQQAIDLATAGKMSLLDLYKKLEDPNPEEKAANVWLELNAPQVLYANDPRIQQVMQMQQAAAQQQAQMQQDQTAAQADHDTQNKIMDHESKMQLQQQKQQGDQLLAQSKIQ